MDSILVHGQTFGEESCRGFDSRTWQKRSVWKGVVNLIAVQVKIFCERIVIRVISEIDVMEIINHHGYP